MTFMKSYIPCVLFAIDHLNNKGRGTIYYTAGNAINRFNAALSKKQGKAPEAPSAGKTV